LNVFRGIVNHASLTGRAALILPASQVDRQHGEVARAHAIDAARLAQRLGV